MYTRAYPQREVPLPQNYSGVALMPEKPPAEEAAYEEEIGAAVESAADEVVAVPSEIKRAEAPKEGQTERESTLPSSDLLLLSLAALLAQSGSADGELLTVLLLLMMAE